MATFEEAFDVVNNTFRFPSSNAQQKTGIRKIVEERKDVFVNLPTGFRKSLLYQAQPLVFDLTSQEPGHVIVSYLLVLWRTISAPFEGARAKSS